MVTYQFTPCRQKQQNNLLFHRVDIASVVSATPSNAEQRKQSRGPQSEAPSLLGLLGDHVARGGDGPAAVGLLLLGWF